MVKTKWKQQLAALVALGLMVPASCQAGDIPVTTGQKIAFLGDSITQQGNDTPSGYVRLVISGLEANGIKAVAVPAGISGHTSKDMLERLDRDVLSKKPDWMTLSCGVNDVWHGDTGVAIEPYKQNITEIVNRAQAANIKVMLLTSTMIGEDQPNGNNQKLTAYNDFLRSLAKDKKLLLADLNADMQTAVAAPHQGNLLTVDGVHMNLQGNQMMASGILKAFGLSDAQMRKAHEFWLDIPNAVNFSTGTALTIRQMDQLNALAVKQGRSVNDLLNAALGKAIEALLKNPAH